MRKWVVANAIVWLAAALVCCAPQRVSAQDEQASKTPYTLPEYNAYQAAAGQTEPQAKIQALDDFVSKFPNSALMPLVDQQYYSAYNQTKNYPKLIEYVDKFLAVPDDKYLAIPGMDKKRLIADRAQALYFRALAFNQSFNEKDANAAQELTDARKYALQGLDALNQIQKPEGMTDETFTQQKKPLTLVFNYTAARAALLAKDYKDAIDSYNAYIAASGGPSPSVASVYYQIGVTYLQMVAQQMASQPQTNTTPPSGQPPATTNPPATSTTTPPTTPGTSTAAPATSTDNPQLVDLYMNGFWNLAKSLSLNVSGTAQVKSYLRAQMFNYEQPACGSLLDDQMNDLIQQAGTQTARPATYSIPSAADLGKILQSSNLLSILSDLQAGGDKAKMTWLAVCGQEIPNVVGKIIDITPGTDSIDFKVFTAATGEEIQAATTPNLDVTVFTSTPSAADTSATTGANGQAQAQTPPPVQPEVSRLQKGDGIKFTGTLTKYDASPFLLYFSKVQVDPSVIPKEKTPARRPHRPGVR